MTAVESCISFDCRGERLLGVLAMPAPGAAPASGLGVLIIVGGPQYRVGSHRQFVQLARALAAAGHAVLRFDARGMGDSTGALAGFEDQSPDILAALKALQAAAPGLKKTVLWGLCDGASAALLCLHGHGPSGIDGLILVNPWVRSAALHARTRLRHYYLQRLLSRDFWSRLLTGQVRGTALGDFVAATRTAGARAPNAPDASDSPDARAAQASPATAGASSAAGGSAIFVNRMTQAASAFGKPMLFVLSGRDQTAREFEMHTAGSKAWRKIMVRRNVQVAHLADADHTFSRPGTLQQLNELTHRWAATL